MPKDYSNTSPSASIDFDLLERIGRRLETSDRFVGVEYQPTYAPDPLVVEYDLGFFPASVDRAILRVRWFENNDFNLHYSEQRTDGGGWECRWDRHPSEHNTRDHFHPPPDARTPGIDDDHPSDWRDVFTNVLGELDDHVREYWKDR